MRNIPAPDDIIQLTVVHTVIIVSPWIFSKSLCTGEVLKCGRVILESTASPYRVTRIGTVHLRKVEILSKTTVYDSDPADYTF